MKNDDENEARADDNNHPVKPTRREIQRNPRQNLQNVDRRASRKPYRGDRLPWRLGIGQRGGLSPRETYEGSRPGVRRTPGPALTQLHGRRSGGLIWQGSDDQSL